MYRPNRGFFQLQCYELAGGQSAVKCRNQTPRSWKGALMNLEVQVGVHERWAATAAKLFFIQMCAVEKKNNVCCCLSNYRSKLSKQGNMWHSQRHPEAMFLETDWLLRISVIQTFGLKSQLLTFFMGAEWWKQSVTLPTSPGKGRRSLFDVAEIKRGTVDGQWGDN